MKARSPQHTGHHNPTRGAQLTERRVTPPITTPRVQSERKQRRGKPGANLTGYNNSRAANQVNTPERIAATRARTYAVVRSSLSVSVVLTRRTPGKNLEEPPD